MSGTPAKLEMAKDSLSIRMQEQAFHLSAKVDIAMPFKIRLAMGLDWGALGCMETSRRCRKELTFTAKLNLNVAFGIHWDDNTKKIDISVDTKDSEFTLVLQMKNIVRLIRTSIFQTILQRS